MAIIQDDLRLSSDIGSRSKFSLPDWVISGETTDIYFRRAQEVLEADRESLEATGLASIDKDVRAVAERLRE